MVHEHEHEQKVHEQFDMAIWLYAKSHIVSMPKGRRKWLWRRRRRRVVANAEIAGQGQLLNLL